MNMDIKLLQNQFMNFFKKWIKITVCVPSEYVPKLAYPKEIPGNIFFGINKNLILNSF